IVSPPLSQMEYVRGTVLNLNWVSVKFFTEGWTFFFQQESLVLALLCGASKWKKSAKFLFSTSIPRFTYGT
ncbi:hypothetical protein SK128_002618, partial [Halocaridina rubra]